MARRVRSARDDRQDVEDVDDFRELEAALVIDEYALEEALRDQASLFYRVASAYALAVSRRDAAKQAVADAEAAAEIAVRAEADASDKKPPTVDHVRAIVTTDPRVSRAREKLASLAEDVARLSALRDAFQQRSYALKDLAGLYVANYYSASEHSGNARELRNHAGSDARRAMSAERRRA